MNRLRHPVRAIREPFGTAGLIVACIALIAALAGGAYAASGLTGKQKKEVKKIAQTEAKKFQGTGPAGPAGPAGPQGPAGSNGKDGAAGAPGADGKGVVVGTAPTGAGAGKCVEGGITVEVEGNQASKKSVCNGEEGAPGEPGQPWTAGGTLPPGETQTGTWAGDAPAEISPTTPSEILLPVSFPLPLEESPEAIYVPALVSGGSGTAPGCPGVIEGTPQADPGKLCVYEITKTGNLKFEFFLEPATDVFSAAQTFQAGPAGVVLYFTNTGQQSISYGVWAVTAESSGS
jgi:hypothetical protein